MRMLERARIGFGQRRCELREPPADAAQHPASASLNWRRFLFWIMIRMSSWAMMVGSPWMMDAFTISNSYPYSTHYDLGDNTINYMRNSVKVEYAYKGTTTFFVFDRGSGSCGLPAHLPVALQGCLRCRPTFVAMCAIPKLS